MMRRKGGRVYFDLSDDDYDALMLALGSAVGAAMLHQDTALYKSRLKLANTINDGNPSWTPYAIEVTRHGGSWLDQVVTFAKGVVETWRGNDGRALLYIPETRLRRVRIVLTIAHLNHTPGDDRDSNLMALCQWCHLHYDKQHHAETRAVRKDSERPLLAAVALSDGGARDGLG